MTKDDRILPFTKIVAAIVVPFLLLAFLILYLTPDTTATRWAWHIASPLTAMYMGAGYLGGSWLFINAIFDRRWHRVAAGFPAVTTFAASMGLATFLHWEVFDPGHFPFILWLILYVVTPLLVPYVWWRNQKVAAVTPESRALLVPAYARWGLGLLGGLLLANGVIGFLNLNWLPGFWAWPLTPLTARTMSGWLALLGVGGLAIARDDRWSAWEVGLQSIAIWQFLVLIAAFINADEFSSGLFNWYTVSVALVLVGMVGLQVQMTLRQRRGLIINN